ncbi:hypothetical protein GX50_01247 [[Emmonsia] crescens]|uniref:AMP-dependent synthetase/ligase domain-containing protein n=1 Tax=[Emmonsia] crescens TaxID=73230 RepID=A0A2B7ZSE4_9EURO|nr:hypothetical protein GX50_01247 [Emmonsia crescens]
MEAIITSHPLTSLAAVTAAASYLNAKFAIGSDLRDIRHGRDFARRKQRRVACAKRTHSLYEILEQSGAKDGDDAVWFEGKTKSYGQLKQGKLYMMDLPKQLNQSFFASFLVPSSARFEDAKVDQFAGLLHARDIKAGDVVAVFMTNSPEMVVTILALSKLGAVAGLINTNLRNNTSIHALDVIKPIYMLSTPDLAQHVKSDLPHISLDFSSFTLPAENPVPPNVELIGSNDLQNASHVDLVPANRSLTDMALLIYTSGTTGKPKACVIRNDLLWITSTPLTTDVRKPSKYYPLRTYSPLPLFHGTAFLAGLCYTLGSSGTFCLAQKFSASNFWKDVTECRANRILYVGELCRYLLAAPASPYDRSHAVTHAFGNGLRVDIWNKFKERFGIEDIREIYRATEGKAKFDNHGCGAAGAGKIGFAGPIKRYLEDVTFVVKYDPETQMPVRDPKTGFCIKADLGQEGEVIGRVLDLKLLSNYLDDDAATEKKLLRDVFQKGDLFQRMGDLVIHEESGWVRFQERVGETFRWKGENVSTGEVRDHICMIPSVMDAAVFGVKLDNYDGQAGGAAVVLHLRTEASETEFINSLRASLVKSGLPFYALPRLLRMTNSIAMGGTFKQAKTVIERLSWNPNIIPPPEVKSDGRGQPLTDELEVDTLYWLNPAKGYQKLDARAWSGLQRGTVRL